MANPGSSELLEEQDLEDYFEGLCKGDHESVLALSHAEAHQVLAYSLAKVAQLWLQLEQRTRT